MDSYELEAMRKFLDSLGERLDDTKGDSKVRAELNRLTKTIDRRLASLNKQNNTKSKKRPADEYDISRDVRALVESIEKNTSVVRENTNRRSKLFGDNQDTKTIKDRILDGDIGSEAKKSKAQEDLNKQLRIARERVTALNDVFKTFASSISKFVGSFDAIFKTTENFIERNANAYRGILNSSEGSIRSLMEMRQTATDANMTFEDFSKAMESGSDGVRLLGGKQWAAMNKAVREATRNMGMMGMTFDQIVNTQSTYLEILKEQGIDLSRRDVDLSGGMIRLVRSSEKMANIMGVTREEQLKLAAQASRDKNFNMALKAQGFDAAAIAKVSLMAENIEQRLGSGAAAMYKDMLTFGTIVNEDAALAAAAMPELVGAMQDVTQSAHGLKNGLNVDNFELNAMEKLKNTAIEIGSDSVRMLNYAQQASIKNNQNAAMFSDTNKFVTDAGAMKIDRDAKAGTDEKNQGDLLFLTFGELVKKFQAGIQNIFDNALKSIFATFGKEITGTSELLNNLAGHMKPLMKKFTELVGENAFAGMIVVAGGVVAAFKLLISPIFEFTRAIIKLSRIINRMDENGRIGGSGNETLLDKAGKGKKRGKLASAARRGLKYGGSVALIGAALEGYDYLSGDKEVNAENLTKSGLTLGGGAAGAWAGTMTGAMTGAALGTVIPGVGNVVGGVLGGALGLAGGIYGSIKAEELGEYLFNKNDQEKKDGVKDDKKETSSNNRTEQKQKTEENRLSSVEKYVPPTYNLTLPDDVLENKVDNYINNKKIDRNEYKNPASTIKETENSPIVPLTLPDDKHIEKSFNDMLKSNINSFAKVSSYGSEKMNLHDDVMKTMKQENQKNLAQMDQFGDTKSVLNGRNNVSPFGEERVEQPVDMLSMINKINDNSQQQIDLLREELYAVRSYNEKIINLLEEGNRNTRELRNLT